MQSLDEVVARALLAHSPPPPTTRDWDALTDAERALWVRYAATAARAWQDCTMAWARRELAEALKTPPDPGRERSPEELAENRAFLLAHYARHLDGCAEAPCTCGLRALLP
jgi:hypothetical protein